MTGLISFLWVHGFAAPARLWLLLVPAALLAAYVASQFVRRQYAVRFSNLDLLDKVAPKRPGWRRHVPAGLFLVGLLAGFTAVAQPRQNERVPRQRATIVLALDTSLSMEATDVSPTRIESAKAAAEAFVARIPAKLNVGLVSFDTGARLNVAPTTDRQAVRTAIERLQLHEGTSIGDAVDVSLDAIAAVGHGDSAAVPAAIVLLSDGATTVGKPTDQAVPDAKKAKVPVWTIAYGTPGGTISLDDGSGQMTQIPVPVDADALASLAQQTGGGSFRAESSGDLAKVYGQLGSSIGYDSVVRDATWKWVAAAMAAMAAAGALSLLWFQRLP